MRLVSIRFLALFLLLAIIAASGSPQQSQPPLTKGQVMDLVKFGMSAPDVVEKIKTLGIDFELTDDYLQALQAAGAQEVVIQALRNARPKPLSREQVGKLVAGGVPSGRAAALVKQRGIDFMADEEYLNTLQVMGADNVLITAVQEANAAARVDLDVVTSPGAEVFLDGESQGRANVEGQLTASVKLGTHSLKVTLAMKQDFEQSITIAGLHAKEINARLVDVPGSIRLRTLAGASNSLDGERRGTADASGEFVLDNVPAGPHELRVSASTKQEFVQSVEVTPGQETRSEVTLQNAPPPPGTVHENPKDGLKYVWIPAGRFMMGCSPGDNDCQPEEIPSHLVTISKGFWMGQTVVTASAYKRFVGVTKRQMPLAPKYNSSGWLNDSMPIVDVGWKDGYDFCAWAGGRLPTEAEWEYAARGGSTEALYGPPDEVGWYFAISGPHPHPVGQKRPNGFGLYDMMGNVWVWLNDWYDPNYYRNSGSLDPAGPTSGTGHVGRGTSWRSSEGDMRVSRRFTVDEHGLWFGDRGIRCAADMLAP